jgi:hypothetical protein
MRWILTDHAKARQRDKRRAGLALPLIKEIRWLGSREEDAFDLDRALSRLEEIYPDGCNLYNAAGLPAAPFRTDTW